MHAAADLQILIPCKKLSEGKSRLAPILDAGGREYLCRTFLIDTLIKAVAIVEAGHVYVVSPDQEVAAIAHAHGVTALTDAGFGLNGALDKARRELTRVSPMSLLVLPIDLPVAQPPEIARLLQSNEDILIAPDRGGSGTNLLRLGPAALAAFAFQYGSDSFAAHQAEARRLGLSLRRLASMAIGFDIDQPEDYLEWANGLSVNKTPMSQAFRQPLDGVAS